MADIGVPTPKFSLNLPTVGDFLCAYRVEGDPLPVDSELFFLLGDPPLPSTQWDFVRDGDEWSLKVESDEVAGVSPNTKYWLVLVTDPADPDTRIELQTGAVKKVNSR